LAKKIILPLRKRRKIAFLPSLVRRHLKYAKSLWNPHRQGLIKDLEKVGLNC